MFTRLLSLVIVAFCSSPFSQGSPLPPEADRSLAADALKILQRDCLPAMAWRAKGILI